MDNSLQVGVNNYTGTASEEISSQSESDIYKKNRRVALASFVGTLLEVYDFVIFGVAAALVFPKILYPALGTAEGLVVSFATFGVAFVVRPLGAILFGHFGDRIGRKSTLVASLVMMGLSTVIVGLTPTAETIGVAAPIIVVIMRVFQGIAAGGEWAGASLFSSEHAPKAERGFWATFPLIGASVSFGLGSLTFLLTGLLMSNESFIDWGWRIPFVSSILLFAVSLYVRLKIEETPVFRSQVARAGVSRMPFVEAIKGHGGRIVVAGGIGLTAFSFFFLVGTYLTSYATTEMGLSRNFTLATGVAGAVSLTLATILGSKLSDRFGRRWVLACGHISGALWGLFMFQVLVINSGPVFVMVVLVTMFISGISFGPIGAFLPELFPTRYRQTAAGLSYNLGTVIGGGITPLLAPAIVAAYGAAKFGMFMSALCVIALICTLALPETRHSDMNSHDE